MSTAFETPVPRVKPEKIDQAVIRFAGDSGDGMQITGSQFTNTVALYGNDIATFPDFPAEIRAPAGTLAGRERISAALRFERRLHAGRCRGCADRDESRRAQDQHRGPQGERNPDRQFRQLQGKRSAQGADDRQSAGRSFARRFRLFSVELERLTRAALEDLGLDAKSHGPLQKLLRAGHVLLALQPVDGIDATAGSTTNSRTSRCWSKPTSWR